MTYTRTIVKKKTPHLRYTVGATDGGFGGGK